jgi:RHS repeat-associated protein
LCSGRLGQPTSLTGAFEDYRYDALGRRVQVRTRMDSVCQGSGCNSSLRWVVWDGSEIAAEIRGAGGDGIAVDSLEQGSGHGPFYGTVDYLNGPNMDEPLEIQGILVYRTWRGLIDGGQCLTGECGTGTIDYPGLTYEAYLSLIPSTQSAPTSWHGTLFAEGQDDGGLMYRRNRYYDPGTGQFTQEDPLGLGGGMNVYGFVNGDPVNFADHLDCSTVTRLSAPSRLTKLQQ